MHLLRYFYKWVLYNRDLLRIHIRKMTLMLYTLDSLINGCYVYLNTCIPRLTYGVTSRYILSIGHGVTVLSP